jgi:cellulose synthase/poly-beta-1,6-N-acetylglucosamine synthase-like glycosyltransferase
LIEILQTAIVVLLLVPLLVFSAYGVLILYYGRLKKRKQLSQGETCANDIFEPKVSIVIPTHNEEKVISKKIENILSLKYPKEKLEVVFVDDSTDSTPQRIQESSRESPSIHLVRFGERMGYSPSMIAGCKEATGEIVILNDAASFLDVDAVDNLIKHFVDPRVGVVTGNDVILNADEQVGKSESFYQRIFNFLRIAETNMDSTFYIKGEATAVRKKLVEDLTVCSETFDTTAGLFVRQKGYQVIFDPSVKFYEYAPSTHSGRIKQKTIRAANLVKVLWRFKGLMFKRKYGKYGCVILPMNFAMLVIAPLLLLSAFILLIPLSFFDLGFSLTVWGILGCAFLLSFVFSRSLLFTVSEFEYSLLKALFQIAFTRKTHDKIDKVDSTRRLMN